MKQSADMTSSSLKNHKRTAATSPPRDTRAFIAQNLREKYKDMQSKFEDLKVVNDLIYNESTHIVSVFKDYLIYDDYNEFLKRYYKTDESLIRLPNFIDYYAD